MVKFFINRPIFATVLALIIVVAGVVYQLSRFYMTVPYDIGIVYDIKIFAQLVGTDRGVAYQDGIPLFAVGQGDGDV